MRTADLLKSLKIRQVFESCEGELMRAGSAIKRLGQCERLTAYIDLFDIDLPSNARAFDQRSNGNIGDIGHRGQGLLIRGLIGRLSHDFIAVPSGIGIGLNLPIAHDPAAIEYSFIVDRRLHIKRFIQLYLPPAHIKAIMIVEIQQRLIGFFECQNLVAKSINVAGQVKVFQQGQTSRIRHGDIANKTHLVLECDGSIDAEGAPRHQNFAAIGRLICRFKRVMIVGKSVADGPIIPQINRANQLIDESTADVFNNNILNAHNAAARACEIEAKMSINGIFAPMQIHTGAVA